VQIRARVNGTMNTCRNGQSGYVSYNDCSCGGYWWGNGGRKAPTVPLIFLGGLAAELCQTTHERGAAGRLTLPMMGVLLLSSLPGGAANHESNHTLVAGVYACVGSNSECGCFVCPPGTNWDVPRNGGVTDFTDGHCLAYCGSGWTAETYRPPPTNATARVEPPTVVDAVPAEGPAEVPSVVTECDGGPTGDYYACLCSGSGGSAYRSYSYFNKTYQCVECLEYPPGGVSILNGKCYPWNTPGNGYLFLWEGSRGHPLGLEANYYFFEKPPGAKLTAIETYTCCTQLKNATISECGLGFGSQTGYEEPTVEERYSSSTGYLQVVFVSYYQHTGSGFVGHWNVSSPVGATVSCTCNQVMPVTCAEMSSLQNSSSGSISLSDYANDAHCEWLITAGGGDAVINLTFASIDLESCCDHVTINQRRVPPPGDVTCKQVSCA
jgi:hypothetical protein